MDNNFTKDKGFSRHSASCNPRSRYFPRNAATAVKANKTKSAQQQKSNQRKQVSFASHATVVDIPNCFAVPEYRRGQLWWTRREIQSIRELECNAPRRNSRWEEHYTDPQEKDANESTSLGLYTPLQEERCAEKIFKSCEAVLLEWKRQETSKISLPDYLAVVSRKCTRSSKFEAHLRATSLALELQNPHVAKVDHGCLQRYQTSPMQKIKRGRWVASVAPPRSPTRKRWAHSRLQEKMNPLTV